MAEFLQILLGVIALLAGFAVVIGVMGVAIGSFWAVVLGQTFRHRIVGLILLPLAIALIVWGHDKPIPFTKVLSQQQEGQG